MVQTQVDALFKFHLFIYAIIPVHRNGKTALIPSKHQLVGKKIGDVCCTIRSVVFSEAGLYLTNIWNKELTHKYKIRGRVFDSHISHTATRISVRIIFKSTLFPKSNQLTLAVHAAPTSALGRVDGSCLVSHVFGIEGAQTKTEVGHGQKYCSGKKPWRQIVNVAQVHHVERGWTQQD